MQSGINDNYNSNESKKQIKKKNIYTTNKQSITPKDRAKNKKYDGNKKGKKRHIVVNAEGNLLSVKRYNGSIHHSKAAFEVIKKLIEEN